MPTTNPLAGEPPGSAAADALAGFLVFLIGLPLCLGIAQASGFPPFSAIWTAVAGGLICTFISNSQLTIKGPTAGLLVILISAAADLSASFGGDITTPQGRFLGYRLALGIGVAAGLIQILLGLARAGKLADLFPLTPVHGMLAAIGVILIARQGYAVMGAAPPMAASGETHTPLLLLALLPWGILRANPEIFFIGGASLAILFGLPLAGRLHRPLKMVPAHLVALLVAIFLGFWFDLGHEHKYQFASIQVEYEIKPGDYLLTLPHVLRDPQSAFAFPDFRGLATLSGLKYLFLFSLVGAFESLLSAKAVDLLDPLARKTDFDHDIVGIGVANVVVALIGGLPVVSGIVQSSANIDCGARSYRANLWHGLFLLGFVLLLPGLVHSIPLAALAAMLVYTGGRLASPAEFVKIYRSGSEQFAVFLATMAVTLATGPLAGIASGIGLKLVIHLWNGSTLGALLRPTVVRRSGPEGHLVLDVRHAAVFSNWFGLRAAILAEAECCNNLEVNLSQARLVDHNVMENLRELRAELATQGKHLSLVGLEGHTAFSPHPLAARRRASILKA